MIRLLPTNQNFTPVPDSFILNTMSKMSSTVMKIYLFLLYQFHHQYETLNLDEIADTLQVTESDIFRAIKYLSKASLLISQTDGENYTEISLPTGLPQSAVGKKTAKAAVASVNAQNLENETINKENIEVQPEKIDPPVSRLVDPIADPLLPSDNPATHLQTSRPVYSAKTLEAFAKDVSGDQLIFYTQALFNKSLTATDLQILFGLHDWLGMSFDLIQFLIEYCVENNHTRMAYIEKVAINWHENHIETIEQAKDYLASYPSHYYTVLKAYGIYNLAPIPAQIKMIDKWTKEYLFPLETIVYACEKTILQTGKPELNYTDSILKSWKTKNLLTKEQIQKAEATAPKKEFVNEKSASGKNGTVKTTTFTNYDQRQEDYHAIEKKALEMRIKKKETGQ